jgi:hypothetical protein
MGEKLIVGPISKGIKSNLKPFAIDNDSFPVLENAYQWRGSVKRKRGTRFLTRLRRFFNSTSTAYGSTTSFVLVAGSGNLITAFGLPANSQIIPGTVTFIDSTAGNTYTDPAMDGTLVGAPGGTGTINYATGAITIAGGAGNTIDTVSFSFYPSLPEMGFRDLAVNSSQYPGNLAFDTTKAYNVLVAFPFTAYDVSFYKNPAADATNLPGYTPKTTWTSVSWNGQNYQQFYTINYQGALWATNGITVPFTTANIGMQFKVITGVANIVAGNGTTVVATADLTIVGHGLVVGDFIYVNEVNGVTGINFQTGYVTVVVGVNVVTVTFPFAILGGAYTNGGIAQYLTSNSNPALDCIRWYDGDPTDGNITTPGFLQGKGWVNFMPPLSRSLFSIADLPARQYYLVGAKIIANFKDRLIFFGPVVQASSGSPIYLQDTAIFSQNGTPYYTSSFAYTTASPTDPTLNQFGYHSVLVPENQTATAPAWFEDQTGFGGFVSAGLDEPIFTIGSNEDAIIVGFDSTQTRFMYTGNDIIPFLFYIINSELGSGSTFSTIQMDQGVITRGDRGITITGQTQSQRIDLDIPDENFEIKLVDNGAERLCAQRDFINEWAYFTYPVNNINYVFPTQTLLYNYRDNSWAIFRECYTCYGQFNPITGFIWSTVYFYYPTWSVWKDSWDSGENTRLQPQVVGGNQQGFLLSKDVGTGEGTSLYIQSFSGTTITSPDHCLNSGDFIIITGALGSIGSQVNGRIFQVYDTTINSFKVDTTITTGTYFGGGLITRLYKPFIQTKQFPAFWSDGRKTRIGAQQYLLDTTYNSQITLEIYLSQDSDSAYNTGRIVPVPFPDNSSLTFSTVLFTCPESTNLGLTPYTTNLQMPTALQQNQIWHRINTSLIGDTIQLGFTISDDQMRALVDSPIVFAISNATATSPCVLDCLARFGTDTLIRIDGVVGMTQLNGNIYRVISSTDTQVTIEVDASGFTAYDSGGTATQVFYFNATAEVVLYGFILDLNPSYPLS